MNSGQRTRGVGAAAEAEHVDAIAILAVAHQETASVRDMLGQKPGDGEIDLFDEPLPCALRSCGESHCRIR
jgi:hypothetical protein